MKKKKTFIAQVIIIGKKVPDFGMGKGVLNEAEIEFTDNRGKGFKTPSLRAAFIEQEDALLRDTCKVVWKEKK